MSYQTIQLSMSYFDSLPLTCTENSWQLTAITCLMLACKFQERDDYVPLIDELIRGVQNSNFLPGQKGRSATYHVTQD
jgi:hypothetical protein